MSDPNPRSTRGLLVMGGVLVWVVALLWGLTRKGYIEAPSFAGGSGQVVQEEDRAADDAQPADEPAAELVIETPEVAPVTPPRGARRGPSEDGLEETETETEGEAEPEGPPTYPVWFESERGLGVCKISYEGGSRTANLHVSTRMPEGELAFSYRCGKHRGQGKIKVKPKRVNGVLFCEKDGGVKVKTVRSKEGRCG